MRLPLFCVVLQLSGLVAAKFAVTPISQLRKGTTPELSKRDADPEDLYPAYNISVPVDHFVRCEDCAVVGE